MSLARQPEFEPPARPDLRLVPVGDPVQHPVGDDLEGSAARGIVWGVAISIIGFWLPAAALVGWLSAR